MESTDGFPSDQLMTGQMNAEAPSELIPANNPEGISKDDEDFLSGLNPEEKECLEYLLQTINTLDGDDDGDDDGGHHEKTAESLGSEVPCKSSASDSGTQRSTSLEASAAKPCPRLAASKIKMTKSLSEESSDIILRGSPDPYCPQAKGPRRLTGSHPAHFRKFDTIMRSGVNVQELRSRFLLHLDCSAAAAAAREPIQDGAATIKQLGPLTGSQRSPRHEALQKLGLLQRNSSLPTCPDFTCGKSEP